MATNGGARKTRATRKKPKIETAPEAPVNPQDLIAPYYQREPRSARTLMWVGVVSCAALIILLWGWALSLRVSAISWHATDENKFVTQAKQSWDGAFAAEQAKQSPIASVRSAINALIAKMAASAPAASASSTTTTTEISATSTPTSTNATTTVPTSTTKHSKKT